MRGCGYARSPLINTYLSAADDVQGNADDPQHGEQVGGLFNTRMGSVAPHALPCVFVVTRTSMYRDAGINDFSAMSSIIIFIIIIAIVLVVIIIITIIVIIVSIIIFIVFIVITVPSESSAASSSFAIISVGFIIMGGGIFIVIITRLQNETLLSTISIPSLSSPSSSPSSFPS